MFNSLRRYLKYIRYISINSLIYLVYFLYVRRIAMNKSLKKHYEKKNFVEYSDCSRNISFRQVCRVVMPGMKRRAHKKVRQTMKVYTKDVA